MLTSEYKNNKDDEYRLNISKTSEEEIHKITERYLKGKDSKEAVDNWEDSAFIVYKITDRFGFLHDEELPAQQTREEERKKLKELKRQYKWIAMFQKGPLAIHTSKFRKRVYKGIPLVIRGDAWQLLLNVEKMMKENPNTFEEMRTQSFQSSIDIKQIDLDVNRTFRNHIMFRNRYSVKQQQLFYVLSAYSKYNTEVGYCQGMSEVAGLLLMFMSEEEAFWGLHSLLYGEKHNMHGFFIPNFPKFMRFQDHLDKVLKKFLPKLKKHLDDLEIPTSLYCIKWFLQCFLDRTPFSLTLRLWDIYLLEGERVLIAMAYTILKVHQSTLKSLSIDGIMNFLQHRLAVDFGISDDSAISALKSNMSELKRNHMDLPPPEEEEASKVPFGINVNRTFDHASLLHPSHSEHSGFSGDYSSSSGTSNVKVPTSTLRVSSTSRREYTEAGITVEVYKHKNKPGSTRVSVSSSRRSSKLTQPGRDSVHYQPTRISTEIAHLEDNSQLSHHSDLDALPSISQGKSLDSGGVIQTTTSQEQTTLMEGAKLAWKNSSFLETMKQIQLDSDATPLNKPESNFTDFPRVATFASKKNSIYKDNAHKTRNRSNKIKPSFVDQSSNSTGSYL